MIIAIDGPAASGKGTLAVRLARHYKLPHLDTGLLYRAVARLVADRGQQLDDETAATGAARDLTDAILADRRLRERSMGEGASVVAAISGVRAALMDYQRRFAAQPGGAVLDGRDIGTVICPDADVKLFVTASVEERARRRCNELAGRNAPVSYEEVLSDLRRRDARDAGRSAAPLKAADDAVVIDTTALDADAALQAALAVVERRAREQSPPK